jgi:hypothetical protein
MLGFLADPCGLTRGGACSLMSAVNLTVTEVKP